MPSIPPIIRSLLRLVAKLEKKYPGRHFTLDGHMVGSLGEVYALEHYKLDELFTASKQTHDARKGSKLIQIKTTQRSSIGISSEPKFLLVLMLHRDGSFEEIYNGPGRPVWAMLKRKKRPKNGQFQVRLSALRALMAHIRTRERIV